MTTQTIEVEGLPEGWKSVSYGWPKKDVDYVFDGIGVKLFIGKEDHAMIIVQKIQPRRIVLEEIHPKDSEMAFYDNNKKWSYWREVKETDIPLNSEEPKLSLSVDECKELMETDYSYGIGRKLREFIKENS